MRAILHHMGRKTTVDAADWADTIKGMGVAGVIFDCDGTLVDSSKAHCLSMQAAAHTQGFKMRSEWYQARTGLDRKSLFQHFEKQHAAGLDVSQAVQSSIACFSDHVGLVSPIPDTVRLLRDMAQLGYPIAVATNAERHVARQSLTATGLIACVRELVSITDDLPPKPAPDMFKYAAHLLNLSTSQVVVFEDSPQGIDAALAAGMSVFDVGQD